MRKSISSWFTSSSRNWHENSFNYRRRGFIGKRLVEANIDAGFKVEVLVAPGEPGIKALRDQGVDVLIGNTADYHAIEHAVGGVDTVFHSAPPLETCRPQACRSTHVTGMENLCKAALAKNVKHLVYSTSHDVFGYKGDWVIDESRPYRYWGETFPDCLIDAAKAAWNFHKKGLPLTMVYAASLYGKGSPLVQCGSNYFSVQMENLIPFLMIAAQNPNAMGEGFLLLEPHCEYRTPVTHSVRYIQALANAKIKERLAKWFNKPLHPYKTAYSAKSYYSALRYSGAKAKQKLDWKPSPV